MGDAISKVFLVTGSSRGLGRQIAEKVLAAGHRLVATARKPESLADLVDQHGPRIRAVELDVTDPAAARAAINTAVQEFGRLDVVVNNAGYANVASVEDITDADFREQVDTNLFGVVNVTKAALPVLREQGGGHIIHVSSVGGSPTSPAYEPTVGTVVGMVRSINAAGDPAKVADVVLTVADLDEPPVRLLLGSDAVRYAQAVEQARMDSDSRWRELSVSTAHADATAADLDPLNR